MRSMTAYASVYQRKGAYDVQIVMRSSNFKYLDVLARNIPPEDILLEETIKREVKRKVSRGKVEIFVFAAVQAAHKVYIDEKVVGRYVSQIKALSRKYNLKRDVSMGDILGLPQVISMGQQEKRKQNYILPVVRQALASLVEFKEKQGKIIKKEIEMNLRKLKDNVVKIRAHKPKISKMENGSEDIDEELSLMTFYLAKLGRTINAKQAAPMGKSIDFLTQEVLRELNAASSKTKSKIPALLIVEAKNYLERIREQAQNIE